MPGFVGEAIAAQPDVLPLTATVPVAQQEALGRTMMGLLGFDNTSDDGLELPIIIDPIIVREEVLPPRKLYFSE